MELSSTDVKTFQKLYKANFDIELNDDTSKDTAQHLIQMMQLVYKPITKNEYLNLHRNYNDKETQQARSN